MSWSRLARRFGGIGKNCDSLRPRKPLLEHLEQRQLFAIDSLAAVTTDLEDQLPAALPLAAADVNIQDAWAAIGTNSLAVSEDTGEKPQSKVWSHNGDWFAALPNAQGTWIWRLDGSNWTQVLKLSNSDSVHTDVKTVGNVAHILLFDGDSTQLASVQYNAVTRGYEAWSLRSANANIAVNNSSETATIDIDSTGRMWVCYENKSARTVEVRYADGNYSSWSGPITVASGINSDDIASLIVMPTGQIGVFWSNQSNSTFGFRTHTDGANPSTWNAAEVAAPQSQSGGMADDHLNLAVSADGTLYVAAKTSYDRSGSPEIILLVRRPNGVWDPLYAVSGTGTRPVIAVSDVQNRLLIAYTERDGGGNIYYRESPLGNISFGSARVLIGGSNNNVTTAKANFGNSILLLAGNGSRVAGTLLQGPVESDPEVLNAPPVVLAGADRVGQLGTPLALVGAIHDDGLSGSPVTQHWSLVSGPGAAYFGNATQAATNVVFSALGSYVLRLTASDGEYSVADDVVITVGPAGSAAPELAGFWNFKPGVGGSYSSIIGHLGGLDAGATVNAEGRLALDGNGSHYTVQNVPQLQLSEAITITAWIKPAVRAAQDVVSKAGTDTIDGFELGLTAAGKVFVRFNQASSGENFRLESTSNYPITGTTWMHVGATYDGTTIRLYINGQLQTSLDADLNIGLNDLPLTIGSGQGGLRSMRGELDEVMLTGRALSSGEMSQVYFGNFNPSAAANQPPTVSAGPDRSAETAVALALMGTVNDGRPAGTLQSQWSVVSGPGAVRFANEQSAETTVSFSAPGTYVLRLTATDGSLSASDEVTVVVSNATPAPADIAGFWNFMAGRGASYPSQLGQTGSLQNGASVSSDGRLQLSGAGQYYAVPHAAQLAISQAITLATWINPSASGAQTILAKAGSGANGFELGISSTGKLFVRFNQSTAGDNYRVDSTVNAPSTGNQWMHVAATYDGTTIRLFINGQLNASKTASFTIGTNSLPLTIGAAAGGASTMRGQLDEVLVASRALTSAEISQVHFGSFDPYSPPTDNRPPNVNAGSDRSVPAGAPLALGGIVTDDGLPSGIVLSQWSVVSGPGEVSFANDADPNTAVTFLAEGTYVLRLTASDGALTASDEITVTVTAAASPSILGFWNFHPNFGAKYASAIGSTGSLAGGATVSSDGRLALNGSGQYYTVPHSPALAIDDAITLTAWIKPAASGSQSIISKAGAGADGFELGIDANGKVFVRFNAATAGDTYRVNSTSNYPANGLGWMHVAATYDGTTIRLYVNGNLEGSKAASFTIGTNALAMNFGAGQGGANAFRGQLDEVLVDTRALSAAEIKQVHFGTFRPADPPPPAPTAITGVVGQWDFTSTNDSSGNGNHGTLSGATLGAGRTGQGLRLTGSSQRMVVADSPSLDITERITLAAWIQPSTQATQYIVKKAAQGATDGYELGLSNNGKIFVRFNQDSSGDTYRVDSTSNYASNGNTWTHVAATYDGTTIRLYVNGQLQASKTATFTIGSNDLGLGIGAQPDGRSAMRGGVDDVLIANRALSDAEILALYQGA